MFDHITRERPRVLIIARANDLRIVATFQFNAAGGKTGASMQPVSRADGSPLASAQQPWPSTIRDLTANVSSRVFELSYACDEVGARLEPLTGEEWATVCNNLREARVAQHRAQTAVAEARTAFREAEAALNTANTAVTTATAAFNNAI